MTEKQNFEWSKYLNSLAENQKESFSELSKITNTTQMKEKINSDLDLKKSVRWHFKNWNELILKNYERYGLNILSLQQKLVDLGYDLWKFWVNKNWVDGDFWTNTFIWIIQLQKALGQDPTWVANLDLIKFLFPKTFKTLNKNEGRSIDETREHVSTSIEKYKEYISKWKTKTIKETKKEVNFLNNNIKKKEPYIKPQGESEKRYFYPNNDKNTTKFKVVEDPALVSVLDKSFRWKEKNQNQNLWLDLSNFLEEKWYPRYRTWDSCWANVWEALLKFWIKWLPTYWRDWYKWKWFLENNPNFKRVNISSPELAPDWTILVYDKWYWPKFNSKWKKILRYDFGHVEIKSDKKYWFWPNPSYKPWWSRNEWFIWAYIPISKNRTYLASK